MNTGLKIIILADNTVAARTTQGEHGLAFWIEAGGRCLLFDTGQGLVLAGNAHALGVDLKAVDALVLSHGHDDHTGGVAGVLRDAAGPVAVHAHPESLLPKYKRNEETVREMGMPAECREAVRGRRCRLALSRESTEVAPGIRTTGEIARFHTQEAIVEPFCLDPAGRQPDPLRDDQALFLDTPQGTVVVLGCAHSGVINTLDHIRQLTPGRPLHAVLGGMHLGSAPEARMDWTCGELRRFKFNLLVPAHCTGQRAMAALWTAFPHRCQAGGTGAIFDF